MRLWHFQPVKRQKADDKITSANFQKTFNINCIMLRNQRLDGKHCRSTNTVDPYETAHHEPSHLDLQCLQIQLLLFLALKQIFQDIQWLISAFVFCYLSSFFIQTFKSLAMHFLQLFRLICVRIRKTSFLATRLNVELDTDVLYTIVMTFTGYSVLYLCHFLFQRSSYYKLKNLTQK